MGQMLVEAVLATDDMVLAGALDVAGSPSVGRDAAAFAGQTSGVTVTSDIEAGLRGAQVLIDFTRPEGTMVHLEACARLGVRAVVGTTGFDPAQKARIGALAQGVGVVLAPNMSVGVNVVFKLVEQAARALSQG
jgi:4-hydroxy-tetrahydrodipicolinate reductase